MWSLWKTLWSPLRGRLSDAFKKEPTPTLPAPRGELTGAPRIVPGLLPRGMAIAPTCRIREPLPWVLFYFLLLLLTHVTSQPSPAPTSSVTQAFRSHSGIYPPGFAPAHRPGSGSVATSQDILGRDGRSGGDRPRRPPTSPCGRNHTAKVQSLAAPEVEMDWIIEAAAPGEPQRFPQSARGRIDGWAQVNIECDSQAVR